MHRALQSVFITFQLVISFSSVTLMTKASYFVLCFREEILWRAHEYVGCPSARNEVNAEFHTEIGRYKEIALWSNKCI